VNATTALPKILIYLFMINFPFHLVLYDYIVGARVAHSV